ncbi:MAG: M56 family metallopeptidase [Parasphingorhabdus sp.]|uniref:M56 family metallopeptidase n=1 Tax=Parasphingorhabdus sp. TaxID=2709688 RepID=UPI0032987358
MTIASQVLLHSIWQVSLIALLLWGSLKIIPNSNAKLRYAMAIGGLYLVPAMSGLTALHFEKMASRARPAIEADYSGPVLIGILILWSVGFAVSMVRLAIDSLAVHRLANAEREAVNDDVTAMLDRLASRLTLNRKVKIGISRHITAPCTLSFWKPLILIPAGCLTRLNPDELEAIIAHELAHIKRLDFLHRYAQCFLEAVYFYHPLFAYISKQVSVEREHACDDLATAIIKSPKSLATGLLKTGLLRAENPLVLAAPSEKVEALEMRVGRIVALDQSGRTVPRYREVRSRLLSCVAFIVLTFGMWGITQPIVAKTEPVAVNRILLISLKNDVCDQLEVDNIYWNPRYDQGGPAMILVRNQQVYMNGTPLPKSTQEQVRSVFQRRGLLTNQDVRLRYYGDDIKLVLTPKEEGTHEKSKIYRLTNSSDTVRSFRKYVIFADTEPAA